MTTEKQDDERARVAFTIERLGERLRSSIMGVSDTEMLIYELNRVLGDLVALIRLLERKRF